ncbi:MAG: NUDIX domain-containing protein [Sphingobacteriales bacterium]|nr:NUDIX domain-containing protein [Sphingobacteriales bacterium]
MAAHQKGLLHLAFQYFIFNEKGEMLLQQRAMTKYHFGGIWSNTCCSHPRLGETLEAAAHRRLQEELGFDTTLKQAFPFIYRAEDPVTGLIEHELDTVFWAFMSCLSSILM